MASYTIRDFTEVVGLGKDRDSVIRSGIFLKILCGLGIAKETGTKRQGTGRPAAVYEVPDTITIPLDLWKSVCDQQAEVLQQVVAEVPQQTVAVAESPTQSGFYYDDDDED